MDDYLNFDITIAACHADTGTAHTTENSVMAAQTGTVAATPEGGTATYT